MDSNSLPPITQDLSTAADESYYARQRISNVSKSIELLRRADADSYDLAWRHARAAFFLGQESSFQESARIFHAEGIEAGRRATRVQPGRVEGHFWLGVNLALLARTSPTRKAIGQVLEAKEALLKAIAIDDSYHAAGPLRVLAGLQHHLPRVLGGGTALARRNFERAIAIAPANTVTRIYFAELLLDSGEIDRARSELEVVLSAPLDPDWAFEIERDQRLAQKMLANQGKRKPAR